MRSELSITKLALIFKGKDIDGTDRVDVRILAYISCCNFLDEDTIHLQINGEYKGWHKYVLNKEDYNRLLYFFRTN